METKKPDYTKSAENLCNPSEVGLKITELHQALATIAQTDAVLQENETYKLLKGQEKLIIDITAQIKDMVEVQGSYQDIEAGFYAVKYRRMIKNYDTNQLKHHFPKFVELCVQETINVPALQGQVKGGLVTEEELKAKGVITETPTYAYYIR